MLDVEFDLADAAAQRLFQDVVEGAGDAFDRLFIDPLPSVKLNAALLSHDLTRKTMLDVSLSHFTSSSESTTALANVNAEDDHGRILLYDATGSNAVSTRNKFRSSVT